MLHARSREVWAALTDPGRLDAWFGAHLELEPQAGGAVDARWEDGTVRRGIVEEAESGVRLAFRWRTIERGSEGFRFGEVSRVEFLLEPEGDGTRLTVVEEPGVTSGRGLAGAEAPSRAPAGGAA